MSASSLLSRRLLAFASILAALAASGRAIAAEAEAPADPAASRESLEKDVTQGALRIVQPDGGIVECPLKHTDVKAEIAGFVGRVRVTQTFHNPTKEKVEAVYVFPLPHESAVDEMTMVIGERKIVGLIKRRAEARSIYEEALRAGQTAALLEQERPNIFTQSVGNIEPGQEVKIEIGYVDVLRYDLGSYEFQFPMVVGPRYIPGTPSGAPQQVPANLQGKVSPPVSDTNRVPDASRISPPVLKPGVRNGHDISLSIKLDAGVPIQNLKSTNHKAEIGQPDERTATIELSPEDSLPNKDFVLRYGVVGKKPGMAVLGHTGDYSGDRRQLGNGYFMLMIQPQEDERLHKSPPREIVFLCDVSGSMSGEPTAKVIEAMQGMLKLCRPQDTLQVITFASQATKLFDKPVPVNEANVAKALGFSAGFEGSGGTEMLKGVQLAIEEPIDKERLRIVVMLTDGYIGNEAEIIEHVGKHCGDQVRFWCVGIGSSPNMFLVDGVAKQGGGMGKSLGLNDESQPLVQEIMTRIQRAQLAKLSIDWGDFKVAETYPAKLPELWAGRPVIVYGRYAQPANSDDAIIKSQITVRGSVEGEEVSWPLTVELPREQKEHDALAKVWARQKIEDLMQQSFYQGSPAVEEMVTALALDYRLMSQYTSFVAVDSDKAPSAEPAKPPRRMLVPVPLPAGTRWEGFFGDEGDRQDELADRWYFRSNKRELAEESKASISLDLAPARLSVRDRPRLSQLGKRTEALSRSATPASLMPLVFNPTPHAGDRISGGGFGGAAFGSRAKGAQVHDARFGRGLARQSGFAERESAGIVLLTDGIALDAEVTNGELDFTAQGISAQQSKLAETAQKLYEQATGKEAPKDSEKLRRLLTKAYLLDSAAANFGQSEGIVAAQSLENLKQLHQKDVQAWTEKLPQLETKLDLVIRDQSLAEALAQVATAAKLNIRVIEGSLADVAGLLGGEQPRVSYLDLRRATAAEALDWIVQPARLSWQSSEEGVAVSSDRRRAGESAWIYDVAAIALPLEDELTKLNDHEKSVAAAQQSAEEFLTAVRKELKLEDETSIVWYAPGQLIVIAAPEQHQALAKLISTLQAGDGKAGTVSSKLVETTRQRYAARKEKLAKAQAAERKLDAAFAHDQFSWQLLAAAANGDLDLEALTELQIAWKSDATTELLAGSSRALALRSLWTICEASRSLPDENELAELAASARKQAQPSAEAAVKAVAEDSENAAALAAVLYAALASPDDEGYLAKATPVFAVQAGDGESTAALRTLARVLVSVPAEDDRAALVAMLSQDASGADHVVLLALAAQRAGGDAWSKFRANSRDLVGSQPLPGEVVVLVNRLGRRNVQVVRTSE